MSALLRDFYVREIVLKTGGKCPICLAPFSKGNPPHTDHCHVTGNSREMLCQGCNLGLGGFKDNPESLLRAIKYLRTHCAHGVEE